jgi:RHS repeat-associated protein
VVISATDYSAFGVALYGRTWSSDSYRYGFNGQEKEKDITGSETHTSAEFWMYDARLGRRWDLDPITIAWISSYATMLNSPIRYNDPLGLNAGDPVKISIEGSYDNVTTASFTRACLPADADDGQIVEYSFSEGRKNMVSWKYSKESKVWCPTFYSYLECSGQISNTSSTKYEGREGWSMENLASQFGVDYKSEATLAAQIIEVTEEHSAEANMTGVVAEVVENSAEESLKEPSKYFDPDAAGGTKLLTRLKGAGKLFGALTTAYDVANHSAKAIEHIRADNTAGFIEEGAKAGLAIAAAMAAGATYGAIGGPLGMAAGIAVGVAYSYISDVDWTAKFQEWGWMEK